MLKTACGMVAGTLSMSGYNLADTYFVGQLTGESPMAAMGFTFPVIMLVGCLFHGLGIGVMTTAAQALGARKRFRAATLITSGIWLVVAFSIFLAALGMAFSGWLFSRFGATGETLELVNQLVNPFTEDLEGEDVNIFQLDDSNGRGYRAQGSDFVSEEKTTSSSAVSTLDD